MPATWARRYGLNIEASFSFNKYGEKEACNLAVYWTQRMQHFFDLHLEAEKEDFEYSDAAVTSSVEDLDFVDFVLECGVEHPVWEWAQVLRSTEPARKPKATGKAGK